MMSPKIYQGNGWSFNPADKKGKSPVNKILKPEEHKIKIFLEKRQKGKSVTIINDLHLKAVDLKNLEKKLKALCGAGGTQKNNEIEIQGDHREKILSWLKKEGWGIKS